MTETRTPNDRVQEYCIKWNLSEPSLMVSTISSHIYKVQHKGLTAILKLLTEKGQEFEVRGAIVLRYFNGQGAVQLLQADEGAHLLEFIDGPRLQSLVVEGKDDTATEIICDVMTQLHGHSEKVPEGLITIDQHFRGLFNKVKREKADSLYVQGAKLAEKLIETEQEVRVLHGDLHHENILKSPTRGWVIIDPQCLVAERTYDAANVFFNPMGMPALVESLETIDKRSQILSKRLQIDRKRMLEFAFAYGCLSAAWYSEDNSPEEQDTLRNARAVYEVLKTLK